MRLSKYRSFATTASIRVNPRARYKARVFSSAQVGTIVERLAPGVYEVEFSDDRGQTYAALPLRADQLLQLRHEPGHQAA
jgi:hypothetical protein